MKNLKLSHFTFISISFSLMLLISCIGENPFITDPNVNRDDYVGQWNCSEVSNLYGTHSYTVEISSNTSTTDGVYVSNIYTFGNDIKAEGLITGETISIIQQNICDANHTIHGTGLMISTNRIELDYYVFDGMDMDTCYAVYTR